MPRRKLKTLRAKQGQVPGASRQQIDEMQYREHGAHVYTGGQYDSQYSGWSHATRPKDYAISVRKRFIPFPTGPSAPSGPT